MSSSPPHRHPHPHTKIPKPQTPTSTTTATYHPTKHPNYHGEDPNPHLADEERQETDEDVAMMQQREADAEVAAD